MKVALELTIIALGLTLVSAVPLDFGEVRQALTHNGITLEKQPVLEGFPVKDVGVVWEDCGM